MGFTVYYYMVGSVLLRKSLGDTYLQSGVCLSHPHARTSARVHVIALEPFWLLARSR